MDQQDASTTPARDAAHPRALVLGASRGLGLAVTRQLLREGWTVIATARRVPSPELDALVVEHPDTLTIEQVDITHGHDLDRLRDALGEEALDLLYINAGVAGADEPVGAVSDEDFVTVMTTNALAPLRAVEGLWPTVAANGTIAVVSSRQGSVSLNTRGGHEVYRASKAALNQLMRSFAARRVTGARSLLLLHPGWVQTALGGAAAPLTVEESAAGLVRVVSTHRDPGELHFLDHTGASVAW